MKLADKNQNFAVMNSRCHFMIVYMYIQDTWHCTCWFLRQATDGRTYSTLYISGSERNHRKWPADSSKHSRPRVGRWRTDRLSWRRVNNTRRRQQTHSAQFIPNQPTVASSRVSARMRGQALNSQSVSPANRDVRCCRAVSLSWHSRWFKAHTNLFIEITATWVPLSEFRIVCMTKLYYLSRKRCVDDGDWCERLRVNQQLHRMCALITHRYMYRRHLMGLFLWW